MEYQNSGPSGTLKDTQLGIDDKNKLDREMNINVMGQPNNGRSVRLSTLA